MTSFQKIALLAHCYFTENLGEDCTNLENSMTTDEINSAIQLAEVLSESDGE